MKHRSKNPIKTLLSHMLGLHPSSPSPKVERCELLATVNMSAQYFAPYSSQSVSELGVEWIGATASPFLHCSSNKNC